jgi:hypothetical protein
MAGIMDQLKQVPASSTQLKRQQFNLTNGTANQRTKIAEYQAESPMFLRPDAPMRLAFTVVEQFQTPGDGTQTTYDLSSDVLQTPNTVPLALFEAGSRIQPDSIDYAGDSFTYTGPGSAEYLHAVYVPRDATRIDIERQAPRSQGGVNDVPYDDVTSLLHERNQNKEPPTMDADHLLDLVIPRKWKLQVYAEGPVGFDWDDSSTANAQGVTASNAILTVPVRKATTDVKGLSQAVKQRIIDPRK